MRFDTPSYDLNLAEDERCFYHYALQHTSRPMCLGVSDRALFIARERFLKLKSHTMQRLPFTEVKEVVLSRERGTWVWFKWAIVLAFGVVSMAVMALGLTLAPDVKPGIVGIGGPVAFTFVGLMMLIDHRWRLVLTIRTEKKDWRWRPSIFDRRDEVKYLRETFLDACRYAGIATRRLDLANESEIRAFWKWFGSHSTREAINVSAVRAKLHKLCDRIDVEINEGTKREMIITANYARDAFPIVEELVLSAPESPHLSVIAFRQKRNASYTFPYDGNDYSLDNIFFVPYSDGFVLEIVIYADSESIGVDVLWALCQEELGEYDFVYGVQKFHFVDLNEATDDVPMFEIFELADYVEDFHRFDFH